MKTVIFGQTELRPESLLKNGVSVASASKTNEDTEVVWKFPVKMGEAEKISYLCKNILSL